MRGNKICMNTKAATDLPGQDQQSDEEDEEIHRAHRLQILQHAGSAHGEERSEGVSFHTDAVGEHHISGKRWNNDSSLISVHRKWAKFSFSL